MTRRWVRERRDDAYYKKAKREGYRSRAAFKLKQIDRKYDVLREGDRVVDLGAAPGGWTQVAVEAVGPAGAVVGVDLDPITPLEGAVFLRGDMTRPETAREVAERIGGEADVVISDMSPNISGNYSVDHARSVHLCREALRFAGRALRPGGRFVVKVFEGDLFKDFYDEVGEAFQFHKAYSPPASRNASSEIYVIAKGFKGESPKRRRRGDDDAPERRPGVPPPSRRGNR